MAATGQLFLRPANPGIARAQVPGRGAPAEQRQPLALIFSNVTELLADQSSVLQIMMGGDQNVLDHLVVRPVTEEERPRWNELVSTHHYLKNAALVGEQLCYVAEYQGQWLALLGWSAAARHLRPRDAWIGWSKEQLPCRRHLLANNARFCILADPHQLPNLATRALALCCARLSDDWLARWEHPIVAVESFVDGQLFRGTAYKAAGWTRLDDTSGYARVAEDFYERHERPKQLWVRALDAKAFRLLCGQTLAPASTAPGIAGGQTAQRHARPPWLPRTLASVAHGLGHHRSGQALRSANGPTTNCRVRPPAHQPTAPRPVLPPQSERSPSLRRAFGKHFSAGAGGGGPRAIRSLVASMAEPAIGAGYRSAHRHRWQTSAAQWRLGYGQRHRPAQPAPPCHHHSAKERERNHCRAPVARTHRIYWPIAGTGFPSHPT